MPSLNIDIKAKFAEVLDGMDQIRTEARRAGQQIENAFTSAKAVIGGLFAGVSFAAVAGEFQNTVGALVEFKDGADRTGESVEKLSSLFYDLRGARVPMEDLLDLTGTMAEAMADTGDAESRAARAFEAMGISVRDASGNLRSVIDVIREVAAVMSTYEDGTNKVVLAQSLLGESGAQFLPAFKELAAVTTQSAGVTTEAAEAAKRFDGSLQNLYAGIERGKIAVFGGLIDPLNDLVSAFNDARESGLGFLRSLDALGDSANNKLRSALGAETLQRSDFLKRDLEAVNSMIAALSKGGMGGVGFSGALEGYRRQAEGIKKELASVLEMERRASDRQSGFMGPPAPKREAPLVLADADKASEAGQKMVEALNKQLGSLRQITKLEEVNRDIAAALAKDKNAVTEADQARLRAIAKQIDAQKALKAASTRPAREEKQQGLEGASMADQLARQIASLQEVSKLEEVNLEISQRLAKNKESITESDQARIRALAEQYDAAKRLKEAQESEEAMQKIISEAMQRDSDKTAERVKHYQELALPVSKYLEQLREITSLERGGALTSSEATGAREKIREQIEELRRSTSESKNAQDAAQEFGLTFQSSLEDVIVKFGSLTDAARSFAEDLRRMFVRQLITKPLMNMVTEAITNMGGGSSGFTYSGGSANSTGTTLRAMEGAAGIDYGSVAPKGNTVNVTLNGSGVTMHDVERAVRAGNSKVISMSVEQSRRG